MHYYAKSQENSTWISQNQLCERNKTKKSITRWFYENLKQNGWFFIKIKLKAGQAIICPWFYYDNMMKFCFKFSFFIGKARYRTACKWVKLIFFWFNYGVWHVNLQGRWELCKEEKYTEYHLILLFASKVIYFH